MERSHVESAVKWLLHSEEPAVRYLTRRDVLRDKPPYDPDDILAGPKVRGLLSGQLSDGSFGVHPYRKWTGAHWRLVSLVELEVPREHPPAVAAAETVLDWLCSPGHRRHIRSVKGLVRRCASQEGNALAVCCRLGMAQDDRARTLAESLMDWQWPDGGWNCDAAATGRRSSFHESLAPAWGLHEYWLATSDRDARAAAARAAELFLGHRLFRSLERGTVIDKRWLALRYPPYWHYGILQALLVLSRMWWVTDERAADALAIVEDKRRDDGTWGPEGYWWRPPGKPGYMQEAVDWGRSGPNEMITLNALRVLAAAGRVPFSPGDPD